MMMRRMLLASVVLLAVVIGTVVAAPKAGPSGFSRFSHFDSPLAKMVSGVVGRLMVLRSEANVTAEQKDALHEVHVKHRSEIAATVKSVRDKKVVLRDAVLSGESDEAKIRAAADELGKAIGDAAVKATKLRNEISTILTKEQRQLIAEFIEQHDAAVDSFLDQTIQGK